MTTNNTALNPGLYANARAEIIGRYDDLWEQQKAFKAAVEKFIDDFGQMPLSDQALEGLHFGLAHVTDSYTKVHNAALAERREPAVCFTAVMGKTSDDKYLIGKVVDGETGYYPQPQLGVFETYDDAMDHANALNERLGISIKQAFIMVAHSMRKV